MARISADPRPAADAGDAPERGAVLTPFDDSFLREYRRRHPQLFPAGPPAPATASGAGLPRSASNGYPSEAAFQADAVERLILLGWDVQETLKGSRGNSTVYVTPGWPDLVVYRKPRRIWFAELKQPGNKPSDAQLECHARLRAAGFRVAVVWTLQDLLTIEEEERGA